MASVKMKSTCNACALAKVKCGREKPSCSRCLERGIKCHYDPSRRSGRRAAKPYDHQATTVDLSESLTNSSDGFPFENDFSFASNPFATSWGSTVPTYSEPSTATGSTRSSTAATSVEDLFGDYSMDMQQHRPPSNEEMDLSSILDPVGDPMAVQFSLDCLNSGTSAPLSDHNTSTPWCMDPNLSAASHTTIDNASKPTAHDVSCRSSSCQKACSMRLLDLLPSLETKPLKSDSSSPSQDQPNDHITTTLSRIVERNSAALYSVDEMLNCECLLHDRQCLIVSLIITKVLAWYRAVMAGKDSCSFDSDEMSTSLSSGWSWTANNTNGQPMLRAKTVMPTTNVSSYPLDNGGNARMRAQLVLSELRHVVRTLDHWSQRHQEIALSTDPVGHRNSRGSSSAMCVLIEADLRAALQTCKLEAMESLN